MLLATVRTLLGKCLLLIKSYHIPVGAVGNSASLKGMQNEEKIRKGRLHRFR